MSTGGLPKALQLQLQIKQNTQEVNEFLGDLSSWTKDISQKDVALKAGKLTLTKVSAAATATATATSALPPIRNSQQPLVLASTESRDLQRFLEEKQLGNSCFERGEFAQAIVHYSNCIVLQPKEVVGYSNRAMARLKVNDFIQAEADCTEVLEMEANHVKSLLRRATARKELKKFMGALADLTKVLEKEPNNKQAVTLQKEIHTIQQKMEQAKLSYVKPVVTQGEIKKAEEQRKRMVIQEDSDDQEEDEQEEEETVPINKVNKSTVTPTSTTASTATSTTTTAASVSSAQTAPEKTSTKVTSPISNDTTAASISSTPSPAAGTSSLSTEGSVAASTPISPSSPSSSSSSTSSTVSLRAPKTVYDFDSTYRSIRGQPDLLAQYFKLIKPAQYAALLKTALDGNLLKSLIAAIQTTLLPENDLQLIYEILSSLPSVARFNVAKMMLDKEDKADLQSIFDLLSTHLEKLAGVNADSVKTTAQSWGIKLN